MDELISRQAAIDALKKDMASLDHIIKGMSANDVRLDAYVSQRNQVNYDIYTINNLPPAELGTNLAEVGTDCISRQAAIKALDKRFDSIPMEQTTAILLLRRDLRELPPTNTSEFPNSSDTISRKEAIEAADAIIERDKSGNNDVVNAMIAWREYIKYLQPARPAQTERKWILCNERMPEEREWIGTKDLGTTISDEVYVTFENPKGERFCKELNFQNGKLSAFDKSTIDAFYKGSKPIAWMPKELPEPYKGVKE